MAAQRNCEIQLDGKNLKIAYAAPENISISD